jgi:hypothetical protein
MRNHIQILLATVAASGIAIGLCHPADASPLYFQGFETDTSGFYGPITQSSSGTNGIAAYDGAYYGTMGNVDDDTGYIGYGDGGFSNFEGDGITAPPYPGSSFSQSVSVYIDVGTAAPAATYGAAYWIDMSPSLNSPDGVGCDPAACSDEHNFRLFYSGSSVSITTDGGPQVLNIDTSGWYTFTIDYMKGATGSDPVLNDLDIYDANGNLLSSTAAQGDSDLGTLTNDNLAGPGYVWFPEWQDGFSGDQLAIDDIRADASATAVPEPSSFALIAAGLLGWGFFALRRKRRVSEQLL